MTSSKIDPIQLKIGAEIKIDMENAKMMTSSNISEAKMVTKIVTHDNMLPKMVKMVTTW